MAQRVDVRFVDDLDGGQADETVTFALDDTRYTIDLSARNAWRMRESLRKYIDAARTDTETRSVTRSGTRTVCRTANTSDVRSWAKAHGYEVAERGRLANELISKFKDSRG
jgi:hypothetical protein